MKKTDRNSEEEIEYITLAESECERDLGIYMDNKLTFKEHIRRITAKANSVVGVIRRSFDFLTKEILALLLKALVRPILEYGNSVWQPNQKALCQDVEDVQRRATKLLASIKEMSYPERLKKLKLPSLEHRRKRGDMIELYKYMNGIYACNSPTFNKNNYNPTRGHSLKLEKEQNRLKIRSNYFSVRTINTWNGLPEKVVNAENVNDFKTKLDKFWRDLPTIYDPECYHTD